MEDQVKRSATLHATAAEMPKYKCHKEVWALKIKDVRLVRGDACEIVPEDDRYAPFIVPIEFVEKHNPMSGGYYVVYKDGYKSFSPAEAFEDGYTLIGSEGHPMEKDIAEIQRHVEFLQNRVKGLYAKI